MNFKSRLKKLLPYDILYLYSSIKLYLRNSSFLSKMYYREWIKSGKPVPPPHCVKQKVVEEYKNRFNLSTFVETGTYLGDMVFAQRNNFNKIISIELQLSFYNEAKVRFNKEENIEILQGDSGDVLRTLAAARIFNKPCLFWLDGHYSAGDTAKGEKETPILEELNTILNSNQNHILLIDDARCFIGKNDYPTINELKNIVTNKFPKSVISVADDIIRIEINIG